MGKEDYRKFKDGLKRILIICDEFEKGKEEFLKICEIYKKRYPNFIKNLENKVDKFLVFKRYPEDVQKFISTTNACENINTQREDRRVICGGYFQSKQIIDVNFYLIYERLKETRWRKPVPNIKSNEYEIR